MKLNEAYIANDLNLERLDEYTARFNSKALTRRVAQIKKHTDYDWLSTSSYVQKVVFIGGTNLRLVKGINRFSENLDFDCKNFSQDDFSKMTDGILTFLQRSGLRSEIRDKVNDKLTTFRRNFFFPEFLFELGLSGYREERFLIKVESQDKGFDYKPMVGNIKRAGFFFPFPVPPDSILFAMKLSALLTRQKGRDFYDAMYLPGQSEPDYDYLAIKQKKVLKFKIYGQTNIFNIFVHSLKLSYLYL